MKSVTISLRIRRNRKTNLDVKCFGFATNLSNFFDDRLRIVKVIDISILAASRPHCACAIIHKVDFRCKVFWIIYQSVKYGGDRLRIARVIGLDISKQTGCPILLRMRRSPKDNIRYKVFWICNHPVKFGGDR